MRFLFLLVLAYSILMSCSKDSDIDAKKDKIEFGTMALRCINDCIRLYKLENGKLYPRKNPVRFLNELQYSDTPIQAKNLDRIINLLNTIPSEILYEETYGCPGCVDESFIYLVFTSDGKERNIRVDTKEYALKGDVKEWVKSFLAEIEKLP